MKATILCIIHASILLLGVLIILVPEPHNFAADGPPWCGKKLAKCPPERLLYTHHQTLTDRLLFLRMTNATAPSSRADDARGCSGGVAVNGRSQDAADTAVELVVVGETNRVASLSPARVAPERAAHIAIGVGTVEAREAVAACRRTCPRQTRHNTYGRQWY